MKDIYKICTFTGYGSIGSKFKEQYHYPHVQQEEALVPLEHRTAKKKKKCISRDLHVHNLQHSEKHKVLQCNQRFQKTSPTDE